MARRPGRSLLALLTALAITACAAETIPGTTTSVATATTTGETLDTSPTTSPGTTVPSPVTTTTPQATTTSTTGATSTTDVFDIDAEVGIPDGDGPFPAVVLVHGGGWVAGSPSIMTPLADLLNDNGYLTVNTSYQLATQGHPSYPGAVDDVACAVRYAASHPMSDGTVALVGHSAGAHIGAIVALDGDGYTGGCPLPGSGVPDRFVGLAGPYDSSRLGIAMIVFFGQTQAVAPDLWAAGNPQKLTDQNPALDSLIMYGERDGLVADSFAIDFADALSRSGSTTLLELVEGARHNDMRDPAFVGDLIVTWLDR
jgi:acetyl esterase/lipase